MLKTLKEWYSLKQITKEQYSQLLGIVEKEKKYTLDELQLLAELPTTENLKPFGKRNLTKYRQELDNWDTYQTPQFDYVTIIVLVVMVVIAIKTWTN